jgi:uncharacterized cupredoxin-like copper-binding protein
MRKLLLLIPLVLVAAACGGSNTGGGDTERGSLGEQAGVVGMKVTMILKDFTLTPSTLTLPKTGTYTFELVNEGSQTHNLEIEGNGLEVKGTDVAFGEKTSFTVDFKKAGDYEMYCPVSNHKELGMTGTITVG